MKRVASGATPTRSAAGRSVDHDASQFWSLENVTPRSRRAAIGGPTVRRLVRERSVFVTERFRRLVDFSALAGAAVLLLVFFRPDLLFSVTTATGGDMGAHVYAPWYLKHQLLPQGAVSGWSPDWYAGFPIFHFYFPLVATFQALASYVIPYEIAFKIGTVLGTFFLPVAVYLLLRLLRFRFPTPAVGAILALGFLFMDSFTIFGGNIASSLAGEYGFSLSVGLCLVFLGLAYRLVVEPSGRPLLAATILALAVLSHLVPVIMVALFVPFLLAWTVRANGVAGGLQRLTTVLGLAFALTAFWSIPFLVRLPYTANMRWVPLEGLSTLMPRELWLFVGGAAVAVPLGILRRDGRLLVLAAPAATALALYFVLPQGHVWNARFIPFFYLGTFLCTAYALGTLLPGVATSLRTRHATAITTSLVAATAAVMWGSVLASKEASYVDDWVEHNYAGYEAQPAYPTFSALNDRVAALPPGRVLWEPSSELGKFGTPMALMTLPYWTDHPSLEGLYFESSITTPFHFLTASEVADKPSNPIPDLPYATFDLERGVRHMQLFDVAYYVTHTERARSATGRAPALEHIADVDEFSIFAVDSPGQVVVPEYQPIVLEGADWVETNLDWFTRIDHLGAPLVRDGPDDWPRISSLTTPLPRTRLEHGGKSFAAEMGNDEITFETDSIGQPHWIKTSYFPNWKVDGADGPYLASPSLMMVVPTQSRVRLHYERTWAEWTGLLLTGTALAAVALGPTRRRLQQLGAA